MNTIIIILLLLITAFSLLAVICANIRSSQITEQLRREEINKLLTEGG